MSCFESSTFLKNPNVMSQDILKRACEKLGWKFEIIIEHNKEVLYVYNANQQSDLNGEFALKVLDNTVIYNSYYLQNGRELARDLENQFYDLNIQYAEQTILNEFEALGFKYLPDTKFVPSETEKKRFKMVAHSRISEETEKRVEIEFTIKFDGTVVSDSNYIPEDVHKLADKAMEAIDRNFGTFRKEDEHIKRKDIPLKYKNKAYCKNGNKIIAKY